MIDTLIERLASVWRGTVTLSVRRPIRLHIDRIAKVGECGSVASTDFSPAREAIAEHDQAGPAANQDGLGCEFIRKRARPIAHSGGVHPDPFENVTNAFVSRLRTLMIHG